MSEKEFNLGFIVAIGQIESGKWTGGERCRKHDCIVLCSDVDTQKWGTLSRDFTCYSILMQ